MIYDTCSDVSNSWTLDVIDHFQALVIESPYNRSSLKYSSTLSRFSNLLSKMKKKASQHKQTKNSFWYYLQKQNIYYRLSLDIHIRCMIDLMCELQ